MDAIEKLNQKHMLIMYYLLFGETQKKIAENMNMSERHLSRITNSPVFQQEFKKLSQEMRQKIIDNSAVCQEIIDSATPEAARELVDLMHNASNDRDRLRAIDLVLSYSSLAEEKEKAKLTKPITYTEEQIALFKEGFRNYKSDEELEKEKEGEKKDIYEIERDFSDLH